MGVESEGERGFAGESVGERGWSWGESMRVRRKSGKGE